MFSVAALVSSKIALGIIVGGAVGVGGAGAAAYADLLPAAAQRSAHDLIGAPLPGQDRTADPTDNPTGSPTGTPTPTSTNGPDATGPAAFGLCTAFEHGGLHSTSTAYAALVTAAKGASNIGSYCATITGARSTPVPHPTHTPKSSNGGSGGLVTHQPHPPVGTSHTSAPGSGD